MKALPPAFNNLVLIEQHLYPHRLQSRHHANRVVIAKYAVDWCYKAGNYARDPGERCVVRTAGFASVVPRENAEVIACLPGELDHALHCGFAHLDVKVAELSDGKSIEGLRQVLRFKPIVP